MRFFLQNRCYQLWLSAIFVTISVHPVRADDGGDDFINNLLTDIAPILALFGERITTQFLSHSFSIYDCIIFAACPIGIITATVSVIRVAAPDGWRSLIGRAMESRATTELELLSSTSPDVCELWSGSALVRVMGSPGMLELIYFPKDPDLEHMGLFTLNEKVEKRPRTGSQWPHMEGKTLRRQPLFKDNGNGLSQRDDEAMEPRTRDRQASPSISMNLSTFFNGSLAELRLMTIGVVVQLCVVGYGAMITYYGPWKPHFTKAGEPVSLTAFPWEQQWCQVSKVASSDASKDPRTDAVPRPLKVGSMAGVLVSLVGFVIQFSGLRLMNWSATLAQLIGMAIMTILRAYLRMGLVNESKALRADDDYELEWLGSELVTGSDRLWDVRKKTTNEAGPQSPSFSWLLGRDEGLFENKPQEPDLSEEKRERPGEEQDLSDEEQDSSEEEQNSSEEEEEEEEQNEE
ncbi:hypothetical protein NCS52_00973600 [Fusarium sp. LHS14.1]|nr:hypothetical protein NCS52_00973600 [Fusarium sp. LHS14.1]